MVLVDFVRGRCREHRVDGELAGDRSRNFLRPGPSRAADLFPNRTEPMNTLIDREDSQWVA